MPTSVEDAAVRGDLRACGGGLRDGGRHRFYRDIPVWTGEDDHEADLVELNHGPPPRCGAGRSTVASSMAGWRPPYTRRDVSGKSPRVPTGPGPSPHLRSFCLQRAGETDRSERGATPDLAPDRWGLSLRMQGLSQPPECGTTCWGASPHMRGLRPVQPTGHSQSTSIPAHAGRMPERSSAVHRVWVHPRWCEGGYGTMEQERHGIWLIPAHARPFPDRDCGSICAAVRLTHPDLPSLRHCTEGCVEPCGYIPAYAGLLDTAVSF